MWRREEFEDVARGCRGDASRNRWRNQCVAMVSLPVATSDGEAPSRASLADRVLEARSWLLNPERKRVVSVGTGTPTPTRVRVSGPGLAADVVVRQSEYGLAWCEGLAPGPKVGAVSAGTAVSKARAEPARPMQRARITAGMHLASCVVRCVQVVLRPALGEPAMRRAVRQDAGRVERVLLFAAHLAAIGVAAATQHFARAAFFSAEKGADAADAFVAAVGVCTSMASGVAEVTCMPSDVAAVGTSVVHDAAARRGVAGTIGGGVDAIFVADSDGECDCGNSYGSADVEGPENDAGGLHVGPTTYDRCVFFSGHLKPMESSNDVCVVG